MFTIILIAVFFTSILTMFSGFGLGTILMPVYAIFYPLDVAIALTAIVHFMNNIFKFILLGRQADRKVVLALGLPGIIAAFIGAGLLLKLQGMRPLLEYSVSGHVFYIMPVKLAIAVVMIIFALLEVIPRFRDMSFDKKHLVWGGLLSGFFGGLSGHQGALRSAFLVKCGLSKESFVATGVVIACLVDISRLTVYGAHLSKAGFAQNAGILLASIVVAFIGVVVGRSWLEKVTIPMIQKLVAVMLLAIAVLLAAGVV